MPRKKNEVDRPLLGYMLTHASKLIDNEFKRYLKKHKLTLPAWQVLYELAQKKEESINNLAKWTVLNQPTLTNIVDRLVSRGLVIKRVNPQDKRVFFTSLSEEGEKLTSMLISKAEDIESEELAGYSSKEITTLKKTLSKLIKQYTENE